ncbi:MAG: folylpolyglutamate synthase/dihydrofolate synthase family protein [Clostridia bacterium]|nr:folylpolyglutamate synthase/dihydrofolate synthase family protein [Clostridia bacterium]
MIADALIVFALDRLLGAKLLKGPSAAASAETAPVCMDYDAALDYIHHVTWRSSRLGLERTRELLEKVGNPQRALKFIHIAGTNGKGSTLAMLSSILTQAGYVVGSYSSPFIDRFNERMQVGGQPIADEELAALTSQVRPIADDMADHPTEFELITVIAMLYFQAHACDIVVLEAGMGGELDSTNVIDTPELAIITNMGFDHVRELGPSMADIARAKAGIIKADGDVLIYGRNAEADAVFAAACRERHARLRVTDHSRARVSALTLDAMRFDFLPEYHGLLCPLVGSYQQHNAAVALTAVEILKDKGWRIDERAVRDGLAAVQWPARFEILQHQPLLIIDGGHNPQGVEAAAESLRAHLPGRKLIFLLGVMADKDVPHMLGQIAPLAASIVTVTPDNPRAMAAEELAARARSLGCDAAAAESVAAGLEAALRLAGTEGAVCALGSLYMLGDIRALMGAQARRRP